MGCLSRGTSIFTPTTVMGNRQSKQDVSELVTTSHIWVVDQIDDAWVSVEVDGEDFQRVPLWMFPRSIHEGDVFRIHREVDTDRVHVEVTVDAEERTRRLEASKEQIAKALNPNDPGGDIML